MSQSAAHQPASSASASGSHAGGAKEEPRFRLRSDLNIGTQTYGDQLCYVLKDPISLAYYRFMPTEYRVLQLIQNRTVTEICDAVEQQLGETRPTDDEMRRFLMQLLSSNLVASSVPGHGQQLHDRKLAIAAQKRKSIFGSLLYIKFPGLDPERILGWLYPKVRFLFSKTGVMLSVSLMLFASIYTFVHINEFVVRVRAESMESFMSVNTLFWLWLCLGISKVIHEFGHGLTCTHYGGECHDMGVLLLVFSPCLYCDTSDAWTMPNKWHRIAISAAGIYVELMIASVSTLIWWHTQPGVTHSIAFAMMALCSLTTFFVNANPLLRYDGYYVLSDLMEIPNLRQKGAMALQSFIDTRLLGINGASQRATLPHRGLFMLYAVLSWVYKWFLSAMILWFFYNVLRPYGLSSLSVILAVGVAYQLLVQPMLMNFKRVRQATQLSGGVRWGRLLTTGGVAAALLAGAILVPLPRKVSAPFIVQGIQEQPVFCPVDGRIDVVEAFPGDEIARGQVLLRLTNPILDEQIAYLDHRLRSLDVLASKQTALGRPGDADSMQSMRAVVEEELQTRKQEKERLIVRASHAGRIVSAARLPDHRVTMQNYRDLGGWSEQPLSESNVGAMLHRSTPICKIDPGIGYEAVLYVEQTDVSFLEIGQVVDMKLDAFPDRNVSGRVIDIARTPTEQPPEQLMLTHGGELPVRMKADGRMGLSSTFYEVRVELSGDGNLKQEQLDELLRTGFRGRAKVRSGSWTAWQILVRQFHHVFSI